MRLIVVDDDRLVVDSLKIILGAQPQIEVVGTGANGNDAVALYAEHAPDIALLDIQMPERDGLSAAREILERDPAARVALGRHLHRRPARRRRRLARVCHRSQTTRR